MVFGVYIYIFDKIHLTKVEIINKGGVKHWWLLRWKPKVMNILFCCFLRDGNIQKDIFDGDGDFSPYRLTQALAGMEYSLLHLSPSDKMKYLLHPHSMINIYNPVSPIKLFQGFFY